MKDSKFNGKGHCFQTRKSRKLILRHWLVLPLLLAVASGTARCSNAADTEPKQAVESVSAQGPLLTGADQIDKVLRACGDQRVALVANQTSLVAGVHLLDTLLTHGVDVVRIFGPEHGFRGTAADGEKVDHSLDATTGLPIVSLYGNNKKPTPEQLEGVELVIFDIQDVGARFYTYISTLHLVMEAAAESGVSVLVLDRPNPHGHYIDGPVLKPEFQSFVGMHPVPVVHGMTVGEYAQMINGEGWLKNGVKCNLNIVSCANYTHQTSYDLPVAPSPNLPNMTAIYLYPSLAFFEGTEVSVGRGTDHPFQQIGMPGFTAGDHRFTPKSIPGVSKYPPHEGAVCVGYELSSHNERPDQINLEWLLKMYTHAPNQQTFFLKSGFFDKLAGTDVLRQQIIAGLSEAEIRASWQEELADFTLMRNKYLLYPE